MVLLIVLPKLAMILTKKFEHSYLSGKMDCRRMGRRSIAEVTEILNNEVFLKTKFKPFEYSVKLCNELGRVNLLESLLRQTHLIQASDFIRCYMKTHTNEPQP